MHRIVVVQGLQYGSEAKGSISAGVAKNWKPDTVATAWGPNAGHTVRDGDLKFVSSMLASGSLYPAVKTILVGPGSVIDVEKLTAEIDLAGSRLDGKLLILHPQAAVLKPSHAELEADLVRIGSTMKGTMQAAINKMQRNLTAVVRGQPESRFEGLLMVAAKHGLLVSFSEKAYDSAIDDSRRLLIEGAQGFSLGIHGEFYPYCTSRDCSTAQVLADCRIPYPFGENELCIIGVCRTYPIRVASRKSVDETEQFTSGGFYSDQHELDWKRDLNREAELTTVTKLPRRVFSFSHEQVAKAARIIRPTIIALTFCDYLEDKPVQVNGSLPQAGPRVVALAESIRLVVAETGYPAQVDTLSYGPDLGDIFNVVNEGYALDRHAFQY